MNYAEFKQKTREELNNLPLIFAFSEEQVNEAISQLSAKLNPDESIVYIGYGGYCRESDQHLMPEMAKRHKAELTQLMQDFDFAVSAFIYELNNHEYTYTWEIEPALSALDLSIKEVNENETLRKALIQARKDVNNDND